MSWITRHGLKKVIGIVLGKSSLYSCEGGFFFWVTGSWLAFGVLL